MENPGNTEAKSVTGYFDDVACTGTCVAGTLPARTVRSVQKKLEE